MSNPPIPSNPDWNEGTDWDVGLLAGEVTGVLDGDWISHLVHKN